MKFLGKSFAVTSFALAFGNGLASNHVSRTLEEVCGEGEDAVSITIVPDIYPYETSWTFSDTCTGVVMFSDDSILETTEYNYCVEAGGSYTFSIFDSYGDGIFSPGYYTVSVGGETATGNDFGYGESKYFGPGCATSAPTEAPTVGSTSCDSESEDAVSITIVPDSWPYETSWTFSDTCTGVVMFGADDITTGELISYGVADHYDYDYSWWDYWYDYDYDYYYNVGAPVQYNFCVEAGGSYTFSIFDSYGDGIYSPGGYTVSVGDETATGNDFGYGESIYFGPGCETDAPTELCEDSGASYQGKDCNWVAQNPGARCDVCSGNICAINFCLVTCNNCP